MLPMPPRTTIARIENETVDRNWSGLTRVSFEALKTPAKPGRRGAEREREQLRRDGVQAAAGGRQLVLADRHPGPPEPRFLEPVDEDHTRVTITAIRK